MTTPTDDDLEALVRSTLKEQAGNAPAALALQIGAHRSMTMPPLAHPVPGGAPVRVGPQTPSRRRLRWVPIGAAIAAGAGVVALAVSPTLSGPETRGPGRTATQASSSLAAPSPSDAPDGPIRGIPPLPVTPDGWRVESYGAASLAVPATWGWGGSPGSTAFAGDLCTARFALVVPGSGEGDSTTPFVGRPFGPSLVDCPGVPYPGVDAVWFASPYAAGSEKLPDGRVAETRAFADQNITVFSADDVLRQRILGTLHALRFADTQGREIAALSDGNGCPVSPPSLEAPGEATPTGLAVCVYEKDRLLWSGHRDAAAAKQYVDAVHLASATFDVTACSFVAAARQVWIGVQRANTTGWDRVDYYCGWLIVSYTAEAGGGTGLATAVAPLRPATVAPWAGEGIRAYVRGPDPRLSTPEHPYFHK
ncbi:hypothetical protein GCM10009810_14950 [Nostocoides vanveenii]|uniref:Septum formation-related domain-containing protein n=1 Tax=Nostocoides vanveenii TaxID=330835 RepID=A0ABP4WNT1_9MICO